METLVTPAIAGPPLPAVGVYPGLLAEQYHRWGGASNSRLSLLRKSPAHLKASLDEAANVDTVATRIGSACHTAVLEPDIFTARYVRAVEGDGRTKEIKALRAEQELRYGPGFVLKPAEYDLSIRLRDAVHAHPTASGLLTSDGAQHELSIAWDQNDVRTKGRLDCLAPNVAGGAIVDLKTTRDASLAAFERSIFAYGYHRQAALYLKGAQALGLPAQHFIIVAIEKDPPYALAIYRLTEGAVDAGWEQLQPLLAKYRECTETDTWPGYSPLVQNIALPAWAWSQIDAEVGGEA